ncbi:MAG: 4-hydroxy-tetrahydrodipicolinate reductase [Candidatus Omnitrophica bacterium]|nr:4-hydroxy-tetrahydrodipicolinate reductase [Candidatus Omnitrophota bacterium]MDE2231218.1 4-hydroxy-tetrahydrodipicolinate reductase [Candidatus Omnitrophota bacterium]
MIKLAVSGCCGRMGQSITALALNDKDFKIWALLENPERLDTPEKICNMVVSTDARVLKGAHVLIEFTSPEATMGHVKFCQQNRINMVIGTTGLTQPQMAQIKKASSKIAIVLSSNMSVGVNLVFGLIRQTAQITGKNYTMVLSETHHVHKKDAPSGTAKTMAQIAEQHSKNKVKEIASIREGEVIGEHTITFESPVDLISIRHHAKTRDIFAQGALVAAKFLSKKKKGLFNMQDVLGLK